MGSDRTSADPAVCVAVCLGWRIAQLYDSEELAEPPPHRDRELPGHLPGFGEMSGYEAACALVAHVGADLASLGRALGLKRIPPVKPVADALRTRRHSRDDVRVAVLGLYLKIRELVAGSNVSAALGFGLGRLLADTALLPTASQPEILAERFDNDRIATALGWLKDLDASLPPRSAVVVRDTLAEWEQFVAGLHSPQGVIDRIEVDADVIEALRRQGDIWRRLLTGEQRPDQLLDRQA